MKTIFFCLAALMLPGMHLYAQLVFVTHAAAAGNTVSARQYADSLNDNFESIFTRYCKNNGVYNMRYGVMSYNAATDTGSVGSLVQSFYNGSGIAYPGTVSFTNRSFSVPYSTSQGFGSAAGGGSAAMSSSMLTMQGDAPKPSGIGDHYTETTGNSMDIQGIRISFGTAVDTLGFYLGDVESRTDGFGVPGYVSLYNGSTLLVSSAIPTGTVNQSLCDGNSGTNFDGCGNDETVWVQYFASSPATAVTDILIVAGDADSSGNGGTGHCSFGGLTLGGNCTGGIFLPLTLTDFAAEADKTNVRLSWVTLSEPESCTFLLQRSTDGIIFATIAEIHGTHNKGGVYVFNDNVKGSTRLYYRVLQYDGRTYFASEILVMDMVNANDVVLFPNPLSDTDLHVEVPIAFARKPWQMEITDISGVLVWQTEKNGQQEIVLPPDCLPSSGLYFVTFRCGEIILRQRLERH